MCLRGPLLSTSVVFMLGACGLLFLYGPVSSASAQGLGPLKLEAEAFGAAGTGERLPFWLAANQYGTVDPSSANVGLQFGAHRPFTKASGVDYAVGVEGIGRASAHGTVTLHEVYGRLRYWRLQLTAGRREQAGGRIDTSLSLGSVVRSRNAPPLPRVTLSTDGYVPVPGTEGVLAAKGHLTHGWLEEDRFVSEALLHEKALYVRVRPSDFPVAVHVGITHHAQWGGTSPLRGPQNTSFGEWVDVAFGRDIIGSNRTAMESRQSQANHLAMYDVSLDVELGDWTGLAYRQFYHEDTASLRFRNVWDGLWGARLQREKPALLTSLLWEHLRMTRQNALFSAGEVRGSDKYYSHAAVYRGGWTYQGRTMGIPLITPSSTTPGLPERMPGIGNSIVVAHHLGVEGHLGAGVTYQALGTYSRNYGAQSVCTNVQCTGFEGRDGITDRRDQWSVRFRLSGPLSERYNLRFEAAAALDTGAFYDEQIGVRAGVQWHGLSGAADSSR